MTVENKDDYRLTGYILRDIIKECGPDILKDSQALEEKLHEKNCNPKTLLQVLLVVNASNLSRYIPQVSTGISMVDVNNIVSCAEKETGLSKKTIKSVLTSIFYGLSLPTTIETVVLPTYSGNVTKDVSTADFSEYESKLSDIDRAINERNNKEVVEYAADLNAMVKAGHPEALYLEGLCYYYGVGTEENFTTAQQYLEAAAKGGSIRANAFLGDIYFSDPLWADYDRAFKHYTVIGAVALSCERQKNVRVILQQKDTNMVDIALSFLLWLALMIFNILLGNGSFSHDGSPHWVSAIFSMVLSSGVFGLGVFSIIKAKYNSIKWMIPCMMVVAMFFAMIVL